MPLAMTPDLHIVSWSGLPDGSPDDRALRDALATHGAGGRIVSWDDPDIDWAAAPVTVLRSMWNYHLHSAAFEHWLERVARLTRLVNDAATVRWNMRKTYLAELSARGLAVVPTIFVGAGEAAGLDAIRAERGWGELVVKPVVSGSAHGAKRFRPGEDGADAHFYALASGVGAMVQPFMPEVLSARERSLVFLHGAFSHAYLKPPFSPGMAGGNGEERAYAPASDEMALAQACLQAAPSPPAIARVDMVPGPDGPLVMELELIEPALFLHLAPGSADRLAALLLAGTERQGNAAMPTAA